jgi:glycosyltransferase involved in cell wall biosynthesis
MKKSSLVSVLMTVYNCEKYISHSVNSILNQSYKNLELILVDDKSTDRSIFLVKKIIGLNPKIKIIKVSKKIGRVNALNLGLKHCHGKYIAILDADDISKKNRIAEQVNVFKKKKIQLVSSWVTFIDSDGKFLKKKYNFDLNERQLRERLACENILSFSSIMIEKSFLLATGGFPKESRYAVDYALYFRLLLKKSKIFIIKKYLVSNRIHNEQLSSQISSKLISLKETFFFLNKSIRCNLINKNNFTLYCKNYFINIIKFIIIKITLLNQRSF